MNYTIKENPAGTKGFAFLEFATPELQALEQLFTLMGFTHVANHKEVAVQLWMQNNIIFLINHCKNGFAERFVQTHSAGGACGMGFLVADVGHAFNYCLEQGGVAKTDLDHWHDPQRMKVIEGVADTALYLTTFNNLIDSGLFTLIPGRLEAAQQQASGLMEIDHLTHNLYRGEMDKWAEFYQKLFNFRQIRYFDIEGKMTGLFSRAMTSPCDKIRIPLNESADDHSQIEEFLKEFNGEGIQHIALSTTDIYQTVEGLRANGLDFMPTPDTYYAGIAKRLPNHREPLERMQKNRILIDGSREEKGGILLQIFTKTVIGPVFFEIIQRKGDEGFGEGNFQALFDSIEEDQIERGVLQVE